MTYTSRDVYEYISRQTNDPILEWKTCRIAGVEFAIYASDMEFYAKISPSFVNPSNSPGEGKEIMQIPTPTLCPEERQRRRLSFRNERKLYKRKCDATGKDIISIYSPDKPYTVYDQKYRRSDARDSMMYGRDFNFCKTFTEQFGELMKVVPQLGLLGLQNENSEYINGVFAAKSSYLCFNCDYIENCLYNTNSNYLKNSLDCLSCINSELLYVCIGCDGCYECFYCHSCKDCSFCIGCDNLIGKQFCIQNRQYTKDIYLIEKEKYIYSTNHSLHRDIHAYKNKNSWYIYDCQNLEDCKYCWYIYGSKDCMDFDVFGDNSSLIYDSIAVGPNGYSNAFSAGCRGGGKYNFYSFTIFGCESCFGCIGLRNKSYCIFNKQYTKAEYEELVPKIITHMQTTGERGEFFHPSLSPFGYNETVAMEYFPIVSHSPVREGLGGGQTNPLQPSLDREGEATVPLNFPLSRGLGVLLSTHGYHRSTYSSDPVLPPNTVTLTGDEIPSDITTVGDDILTKVLICEASNRPFRLQKAELAFYRKYTLPLPRRHPDVRHEDRMKLRPGRTLHLRYCDQCGDEMLSVYPVDVVSSSLDKGRNGGGICESSPTPRVYCEKCYQQSVYA